MRDKTQGRVDLLEIFHARQLRDQILAQLRRLANAEVNEVVTDDGGGARQAARYYEAALITIAELLDRLGDRRPLD